jgi:hypothetical protein
VPTNIACRWEPVYLPAAPPNFIDGPCAFSTNLVPMPQTPGWYFVRKILIDG